MDQTKKLYRSKKNRIIGGVCGGLAEYFKIDPLIIRLIFVALTFADGVAIIIYIILMIAVPEEPAGAAEVIDKNENRPSSWLADKKNIFAFILILIGVVLLLKQLLPMTWLNGHIFWSAIIILAGLFLIFKK
jgi:phage shock protein C